MTTAPSPQRILSQLDTDISACELLLTLLEQEREALANRDIDALDTIIEGKATQLKQLEASAQNRTAWARQYLGNNANGLDEIKKAWQNLVEDAAIPQLKERWESLKTLQNSCKEKNEANGKILARNQKTFNRLLDIVRGQTATPNLYSAAGKSTSGHISHKVGEA